MEKELKPCPFCPDGGNPKHLKIIYHSCESNLIKCMKCEASTCGYDTEEEAIKAWNTRYERTCRMTKKGPEFVLAGWWECSECGPVYPPCNDEIAVWALQKCPRCGAKVVGR